MPHHETVPVDQRWLGMDKRGIPYAVVAIALMAVLLVVVPAIDDATGWDDEIVAGDVLDLGDGVTIVPPAGWLLESGFRTTDEPTVPPSAQNANILVADGQATVKVTGSGWDGSAEELLDQYERIQDDGPDDVFRVEGERTSVTTTSGLTGVQQSYTSAGGDGTLYAFTLDGNVGIVIDATASSDDTLGLSSQEIDDFVASLSQETSA